MWRIAQQETPRKDLPRTGQPAASRTGRRGHLELHAVDPVPISADQEFRYPHRAEPVARAYPLLPDGGLAGTVARLRRGVRQTGDQKPGRNDPLLSNPSCREQVHRLAPSGVRQRHSPPARRRLPHGRGGAHQQRPSDPPSRPAGRRTGSTEARLDNGRGGTEYPRPTGEPRLHGDSAGDAFLVLGRIPRGACPQGLFRSRKTGQQRGTPGLFAPQGRGQIQGFGAGRGPQSDGLETPPHLAKTPLPRGACRTGKYRSKPPAGTDSKTGCRHGLHLLSSRLGILHAFRP